MITIKELTTLQEMEQVRDLDARVWQSAPLATHQTLTAVKNGGIVVGAYDGEQLVGFSYGFAGFNGKPYLCSHMLGIDAAYRSQKIGERLKAAQREIAIRKGYDEMHWTFDPLETRNGYLNLTKLNGVCDTYIENCYGEMQDGFNKGLPSDRFEVHWHLNAPHVTEQHTFEVQAEPAADISFDAQNLPRLHLKTIDYTAPAYALPVPKDFQSLKAQSAEHAMHWRLATRHVFQKLFAAGYAAIRLDQHAQWNAYIFVRKQTLALGGNHDEN